MDTLWSYSTYHISWCGPWSKAFLRSEKASWKDLFSLCFSLSIEPQKMNFHGWYGYWSIPMSTMLWRFWLRIKNVHCVWQEVDWSVVGTICQVTSVLRKGNNNTCGPGSRHMARVHSGIEYICQPISCYVTKYKGLIYNTCRIWISWSNGGSPQYPPIKSVVGGMLLCCSAFGNDLFGFIS